MAFVWGVVSEKRNIKMKFLIKYGLDFFPFLRNKRNWIVVAGLFLLLITAKSQPQQYINEEGFSFAIQKGGQLPITDVKILGRQAANKELIIHSMAPEVTYERLAMKEIEISELPNGYLRLPASFENVGQLLSWEEITYVGFESYVPREEAVVLDLNLNANSFNVLKHEFPNVTGADLKISLQELRFSEEDIDLLGRTVYPDLSDPRTNDHATQMATIIGGAGNSLISALGVLPDVTLLSSGFDEPIPDPDSHYLEFDVQVQNHSYGTDIENFYGAFAQLFDASANANPSLLHVFSSGNSGQEMATDGDYADLAGYANLTGNFKMSKNTITVGAVDTVGRSNMFVSNGPTYDGRIKPEVVAYSVFGSSNSAAMVSGLAGALQERYQQIFELPASSALVKSALINAADDVGIPGIDHQTGFGNIDAAGSIRTIDRRQFIEGLLIPGAEVEHDISLPENAINFKVTLVWNDPAAGAGDEVALINDLNLSVKDNQGKVNLPWILNISPSLEALAMPATRGEDHLNNVEQVSVENPNGPVSIKVSSTSQIEEQAYALSYEWELPDSFEWRYPLVNDHMPYNGETDGYFRWASTFSATVGELSVSLDFGATWEILENEIDLSQGLWRWSSPDTVAIAMARMQFEDQIYMTEPFVIGPITTPSVGFDCGDSSLLQWTRAEAADSYQLSELIDNSLKPIAEIYDTIFVIKDQDVISGIYAITPMLDGKPAIRSAAFEMSRLSIGCYFSSFFAQIIPDEGLELNLQLGSTYQVDEIFFERFHEDGFQSVGELDQIRSVGALLDELPLQGLNMHRAGLIFENGRTLYSDTVVTYYLTEKKVLTFPNPIFQGENLNVFTRVLQEGDTPVFELVDNHGKIHIRQSILLENESIPLEGLRPGLYFYRVTGLGSDVGGRIIVR